MGLYKKGGIWWYFKQQRGRKAEGSCGTDNKQVAKQHFERKVLPSILDGTWWNQAETITFRELAKRYMDKYKRQRDPYTIKHLNAYFGNKIATEITAEIVEDYLRERADSEKSPSAATLYKEYSLGRRIYRSLESVGRG
ncbi:MAG: hypothetical protein ACOYW7_11185 [Nitrospirota bacterium]